MTVLKVHCPVKRSQLRPGMMVENKASGKLGEVLAHPKRPKKIRDTHRDYVWVKTRARKLGPKKGKLCYPCWLIEHLEISNLGLKV